MNKLLKITLSTIAATQMVACGTITQGTSQTLITKPITSGCIVLREDAQIGVTDATGAVQVRKSSLSITVDCPAKPAVTIESKISKTAAVGAVLLDGGLVDMWTGAMWQYPEIIEVAE